MSAPLIQRAPWLVVAAAVLTAGCWEWQSSPVAPAAVLSRSPSEVEVWVGSDTAPRLIGAPTVRSDSVFGLLMGSAPPGQPLLHVALPLASVSRVEVWSYSQRRTLATAAVPLIVASYAAFLVIF